MRGLTINTLTPRCQARTPLEDKELILPMDAGQRVAVTCAGRLAYERLAWWAARLPHEMLLVNNEFAYAEAEAAERAPRLQVTDEVAALAAAA